MPDPAMTMIRYGVRAMRTGIGLLGLLALLAGLSAIAGCGGGSYRAHTQAHALTTGAVAVAGVVVDDARDAALDRVEASNPINGPERSAALDTEAARWQPVGSALDGARDLLIGWAQAIEAARVAAIDDADLMAHLAPIAARVVLLYDRIAAMLAALDVDDVPVLPVTVRALAQAIGGGE